LQASEELESYYERIYNNNKRTNTVIEVLARNNDRILKDSTIMAIIEG